MYNGKSIDSMDFEELRSYVKALSAEVSEISDLYARMKRQYEDMLYNLTRENLSIEYIQEEKEFVNSVVDNKNKGIMEGMASLETRIMQTEDKIETSASAVDEKFNLYTTTEQTASAISQTAFRGYSLEKLKEAEKVSSEEFMDDPSKLYYIQLGIDAPITYYAYNSVLEQFMPIVDGQSIYTVFKQTADGFEFLGNVKIDASLIVKGDMKGVNVYVGDEMTDQRIEIIADDKYDAYINVGTVGIIRPSVSPAQMIISSKSQGADMLIESETLRFNCSQVEGLGVVPVFG